MSAMLANLKKHKEAIDYLNKVLKLNPESKDAKGMLKKIKAEMILG